MLKEVQTLTGDVTLDIVNSAGVLIQQDELTGVKVVAADIGGDESTFALDYSSITITPYVVDSAGTGSTGDFEDQVTISTAKDTFAAPVLPTSTCDLWHRCRRSPWNRQNTARNMRLLGR